MKPELRRFGASQSPVVVIDEFSGDLQAIVALAQAFAPFPSSEGNFYPGLRRTIGEADAAANAYVDRMCTEAAQFVAGAFDVDGFDLIEASFSLVTTPPAELLPRQRAPHFDSTDPKYYALLHYLNVPPDSGTAFYRQRSTGIELVTQANVAAFVHAAQRESVSQPPGPGYLSGSDASFEQIGAVEATPDRLVIYQGSLLHSGIIPAGMDFSADPRRGRLTANLFIRGH